MPHTIPLVKGHTVRWKRTEGPAAGSAYDHTFENDGTVVFREVKDGVAQGAAGKMRLVIGSQLAKVF